MNPSLLCVLALAALSSGCQSGASARPATAAQSTTAAEKKKLAQALANPVAELTSVPIQVETDHGIGAADADQTTVEIQPVLPFSINADWNVITRTMVSFIGAQSPSSGGSDESGLGDTLESLFFSPKPAEDADWVWGAGPVFLLPTASADALGTGKWGLGPTAAIVVEDPDWTYGVVANHIWSFAGDEDRANVSESCVQPFVSYTTESSTTLSLNTQSTYDWKASQWTVPISAQISQLVHAGSLPISLGFGYTAYVETPGGGPDWGICFALTFLFPD